MIYHFKYILIFLFFLMLLTPFSSRAGEKWDTADKTLFVASTVALAGDWLTTRDMSHRYDEGYYENNVVLGRHPSTQKVDIYFASCAILNYVVTDYLPPKYRKAWLLVNSAVSLAAINNNLGIGLRFKY
jgi:hypothetical protein